MRIILAFIDNFIVLVNSQFLLFKKKHEKFAISLKLNFIREKLCSGIDNFKFEL